MKAYKRCITSNLLGRAAHADVFELSASPSFLFVLFGGSGIDDEEYERRSQTMIPVFDRVLHGLPDTRAVVTHVTAPYDVPFNRFAEHPSAAETWKAHVLEELLSPWSALPYFVCGFSGGSALALNGLHAAPRCFGGAALGADAVPPDFASPDHWPAKLHIYSAPNDRVSNHPANRKVIETLEERGQIDVFHLRAGGHRLADYATEECLGELLRLASSLVPDRSSR